jgi:hypothetical protein
MGESIILDPLDLARLSSGTGKTAEELLSEGMVELHVVDGIILPNLRMSGEAEACTFLNQEGRCSIHEFRPGICRLFPLGRYYLPHEEGQDTDPEASAFRYFLQVHECPRAKAKIKVRKWIDTPDLARYERYISHWHALLERVENILEDGADDTETKNINLYLLKLFYLKPYVNLENFYIEFEQRLATALLFTP